MNFKTLLLGSAAAMLMVGGAQAADLTVAEPVDYVKVCDAFGTGFFYSPGTDTCIKVGGYVKFGTSFGDRSDLGVFNGLYPDSSWGNFYTEASVQLTASSVTEYGNLTGFLDFRAATSNSPGTSGETVSEFLNNTTKSAYVDSAYLELGPLKAGFFTSLFDFGRGYNDTGMFGSDSTVDHIQLTYAVNGFGLALSIEDQRDRGQLASFTNPLVFGDIGFDPLLDNIETNNTPDIVGAVTYASGIFSAKIAAAYTNQAIEQTFVGNGTTTGDVFEGKSGWAVGGGLEIALDNFSAGDRFFVSAAYGDNANSYTGISGGTSVAGFAGVGLNSVASVAPGTSWSALASYKHVWTPQLWSSLSGGYANYDGTDYEDGTNIDAWRAGFTTAYTPVKGLDIVGDVFYTDINVDEDSVNTVDGNGWTFNLFLKRSW